MVLVLLCALFLGTLAGSEKSCPQRVKAEISSRYLKVYGDKCYFFNVYEKRNYKHAGRECQQLGGTLATPKTEAINRFLCYELTYTHKNFDKPVWIGLSDSQEEGNFVWDDGSRLEWNKFSNIKGIWFPPFEDCVALDPLTQTWDDYLCVLDIIHVPARKPFICQFGVEISVPKTDGQGEDENKTRNDDQDMVTDKPKAGDIKDIKDKNESDVIVQDGDKLIDKDPCIDNTNETNVFKDQTRVDEEDAPPISSTGCSPFVCPGLNCGMRGFKYDNDGCQLCQCNF